MTSISKTIIDGFDFLKGKSIEIICNKSIIRGQLIVVKNKDYYYELILKQNGHKKKVVLFYPFSVKIENNSLHLDYRISTLSKHVSLELLYNLMSDKDSHPYLNKIVHICELT